MISKNNNQIDNNLIQDDENEVIPDPQIKAWLEMIKTQEPSSKLEETILQAAQEKLDRRSITEKLLGNIRLYFLKRKLGLNLGRKETVTVHSLAIVSILAFVSIFYFTLAYTSKPKDNLIIKEVVPKLSPSYISPTLSPPNTTYKTIADEHKNSSEQQRTLHKNVTESKQQAEVKLTNKIHSETVEQIENQQEIIASNNVPNIASIPNTSDPTNKKDNSNEISYLTRGQEKRTAQNLSSIMLVSVLSLGTDPINSAIEKDLIKTIADSKWKFMRIDIEQIKSKSNQKIPDAVFKIDGVDGSLEFITREGEILWQDENYKENYKKHNNYIESIVKLLTQNR